MFVGKLVKENLTELELPTTAEELREDLQNEGTPWQAQAIGVVAILVTVFVLMSRVSNL